MQSAVYGTLNTASFQAASLVAASVNIHHAGQGFVAAGTPIGPDSYVTARLEAQAVHGISLIQSCRLSH